MIIVRGHWPTGHGSVNVLTLYICLPVHKAHASELLQLLGKPLFRRLLLQEKTEFTECQQWTCYGCYVCRQCPTPTTSADVCRRKTTVSGSSAIPQWKSSQQKWRCAGYLNFYYDLCSVEEVDVFMQRCIRDVKLWQMSVGVFLDAGSFWLVMSYRQIRQEQFVNNL